MMNMVMDGWWVGDGFGLAHWLIFAAFVAIVIYPIGRILKRLGVSPAWSVLAFIPFVNLIGLWVLALNDGPQDAAKRA